MTRSDDFEAEKLLSDLMQEDEDTIKHDKDFLRLANIRDQFFEILD
jgi:hypothetical protein